MKAKHNMKTITARASPVSDGDALNVNLKKCDYNARAYPRSDDCDKNNHSQTKTTNRLRLGTWNLGTMTGRSTELSEILYSRNINICCIQETKWKGSKSRDIGHGYQLIYHGVDTKRNGVGVVLDRDLKQRIINIERKILNIISAYAPQVGCPALEKETFWEDFDELLLNIPHEEHIHIGADLNGHVGANSDAFTNVHGGWGYGSRNQEGLDILNFATKYNFKKYYKDCKVIPGEALTAQHRLLLAVMDLPKTIKVHMDLTERIKWKDLRGHKGSQFLENVRLYLQKDVQNNKPADQMWSDFENYCQRDARLILGVSRDSLPTHKDTSWWNQEVKQIIKAKRKAFKIWQKSQLEEDRENYRSMKAVAKSAVAQARASSRQSFYDKLDNAPNEKSIFKIAKQRHKATLDIKSNKYIKDEYGKLLTSDRAINIRWAKYYDQLLNEEFPSEELPKLPYTKGPIDCIRPQEIKNALRKMEFNKALGPDNIPADIWKLLMDDALPWLTELFNNILIQAKIPNSWRSSYLCPLYKNKGDVSNCNNYRGIKPTSHTLKLWERVIGARLASVSCTTANQFGFTAGRSTTESIQTIRILMEKCRINKENLYFIFIDLEKAFDPRNLVWQAMRAQKIPEFYVSLVQDMYEGVSTQIKTPAGITDQFKVKVGVHQGSALSPLLFNLSMDYITRDLQAEIPWCMLYADDIVLIGKTAPELQETFNTWFTELEKHGLRISRTKTEYMECDLGGTEELNCEIQIENTALPKVERFKYLGSMLTTDARVDEDLNWDKGRQKKKRDNV
ncbi:hypothetical protein ABMA28_005493 [Loxostege sticticalis]|uniref:Reverse transcriptase domain-containing protein n=1 Tax=Loxostege sticticalis TaxID=481309 RepID=A0ABD0SLT0_LOXSC